MFQGKPISHAQAPLLALLPGGPAASLVTAGQIGGSFGETVTFTRATAAYGTDAAGLQKQLASGQPVIETKGLKVEPAHTNYIPSSQTLSGNGWSSSSDGGAITATLNAGVSPDGTANATKLTYPADLPGDATFENWQVTTLTLPAGTVRFSVWLKAGTNTKINLLMFTSAGLTNALVCNLTSSWQLFELTQTHDGSGTCNFYIGGAGGAFGTLLAGDLYAWGAQGTVSTYARTLMPTTTTSATRNKDQTTMAGTALPIAAGAIECDFVPNWTDSTTIGTPVLYDSGNGGATTGVQMSIIGLNTGRMRFSIGTTAVLDAAGAQTWVSGQKYRMRVTWGAGNAAMYRDDILIASVTNGSVTMPTAHSTLHIGEDRNASGQIEGWISNFRVYA